MTKNVVFGLILLLSIKSAFAQIAAPTPTPPGGGRWIRLPAMIQTAHPFSNSDCSISQNIPVGLAGGNWVKVIVKKAEFSIASNGRLSVRDGAGFEVANIPGNDGNRIYEVLVPGGTAIINWSCSFSGSDYGFLIEEVYGAVTI